MDYVWNIGPTLLFIYHIIRPYHFGVFIPESMPLKVASKDMDDNLLQIFADKLKENQVHQDSKHEAIADALHSITK
ncbi:hypothetical protein Lal_00041453 [Lupinus albus]|nr:hypothetical protein Lal_00041453 [Lupinus albus]